MELAQAKNLAISLMGKHGLLGVWSFQFHNKKRALGSCNGSRRIIYLSTTFIPQMDEDDVKDVVLHEIAHALVGCNHGHDWTWQRKALEIGCNGERTNKKNFHVDAKYVAICNCCGHRHVAHKRIKRDSWCKCTGRSFKQEEKLDFIQQY